MTIYRRAWTMQLKPGAEAAYDAAHASVWPELTAQMRADGVSRFELFRADLTIFAVQERTSPFPDRGSTPSTVTRAWWNDMADLMVTDDADRPLQTELREVFSLAAPLEGPVS